MHIFAPDGQFIVNWNKIFLLCSVISLALDPLYFYIPVFDGLQKCLNVDKKLEVTACILRSFVDIFYILHIIFQFRTGYIAPSSRVFGNGELAMDPYVIATHYLRSYFIIDLLAALPLPQVAVLLIIPNVNGPAPRVTKDVLKYIIFFQYVPRLIRTSLFYKKVTKASGFLTETAWAGAAFNLFVYVLAGHVVGAMWYLLAVEREERCWQLACERKNCNSQYLYCGGGHIGGYAFLNASCPLLEQNAIDNSNDFDFGIFLDALQTRVIETRDFRQKFFYCSWWGLQSLSSLGQNLKTSTFYGEILFADFIVIIGLILFSLLIGNMQKYLESFSNLTLKVREMKEKRRDAEELMSHFWFPEDLRNRVRRHDQYKWQKTRGVELDSFVEDLPRDLRRDIKRHLCLMMVMRVPLFEIMDEHLIDAICDRLKRVLYTKNSFIIREGDPVEEMIFIMRGKLECVTTNGCGSGFFRSYVLEAGGFFGEEILSWGLAINASSLPPSTPTVRCLTNVEAFALMAKDFRYVASQFPDLHGKFRHTFRFYSYQWRTWAACFIQAEWRIHRRRKLEEKQRMQAASHEERERMQAGSERTENQTSTRLTTAI